MVTETHNSKSTISSRGNNHLCNEVIRTFGPLTLYYDYCIIRNRIYDAWESRNKKINEYDVVNKLNRW